MIIVVAQRVPYPPNKGEKLRTYHQIKHLVEQGHAVRVYSLRHEREDDELAFELAKNLNIKVTLFGMQNRLFRYITAFLKGAPISVGAFHSSQLHKQLQTDAEQGEPLTILLTASSLAPYVLESAASKKEHVTLLMDFMDVDSDKWAQYANNTKGPMKWVYQRESRGIRKLEAAVNRSFDRCFLIAETEIALFSKQVCNTVPVTKLNNGMDFDAFHPGKNDAKPPFPVFLFTGVMDYKPNVDAVVWFYEKCWKEIKQRLPEAKFVIAGMNPTSSVTALDKDPDIDVTGFVKDILPYYHMASVFVAPFRLARGVQNKVLQATSCALPVVTTEMGAEGISFANSETMFIANEAQHFANACIEAATNSNNAEQKAQRAYQALRASYSWENQLKPLVEAVAL
ncbi:TIGR03087 family PEP-CTERM/XrtA system glycosyltransferase [Alteromonas sediminis]|uniref:TIGR03087 family PEP-CTERM/XrtA system glycosyltransferase n=1 Tax=Alteromonas sediminis TaxID=2259342 RepID=A0A3N5XZ15_9ALTE|nr:TIGR03087 family PEP-CTERM/XrtA system glycosyltransferase [Alteromonas sediminis]RPJ65733.1 TIGR03087 family PEP-CTERM/XrtA system glycosyltransferase [Alteromonas sediminis]